MPDYRFETPHPVNLVVATSKGTVEVRCAATTESTVLVEGKNADGVLVEQRGDAITVTEPGRGRIFGDHALRVEVVVPEGSHPAVRTGSADIRILGRAGHAQLRSGSGDVSAEAVEGHLLVETGSGEIRAGEVRGDLKVKTGSGDVEIGETGGGTASVSTGSGDVRLENAAGTTVVKTGSGDLRVADAHGDTSFSTGSGDASIDRVHRGRVTVKGASGDVTIGVAAGVPVWTDITTVTGTIRSDLQGAGQPQDGQEHVEVRAKTVTGDIALSEV
jgi:putative adhesin